MNAPVQAASKHWDEIFTATTYNSRPGTSTGGYLTWSRWEIKPGEMRNYTELTKKLLVPVLEKLLAEAPISSYGQLTEDYHMPRSWEPSSEHFTVPDAASMDKASKALDEVFDSNPALGAAASEGCWNGRPPRLSGPGAVHGAARNRQHPKRGRRSAKKELEERPFLPDF